VLVIPVVALMSFENPFFDCTGRVERQQAAVATSSAGFARFAVVFHDFCCRLLFY
jgi:hypothetical protein